MQLSPSSRLEDNCHFNSRTHVECDHFCLLTDTNGINFNSRTHVECDSEGTHKTTPVNISTHALTWSATDGNNREIPVTDFNSRTHVECDICENLPQFAELDFNSRTHVECDVVQFDILLKIANFNSRTHVECDCTAQSLAQRPTVFQLTHSRGVRPRKDKL